MTISEAFKLLLEIERKQGKVKLDVLGKGIIETYKEESNKNNYSLIARLEKIFSERCSVKEKLRAPKTLRRIISKILKSKNGEGLSGKELKEKIEKYNYHLSSDSYRAQISQAFKELQKEDLNFKKGKRKEGYYKYESGVKEMQPKE